MNITIIRNRQKKTVMQLYLDLKMILTVR